MAIGNSVLREILPEVAAGGFTSVRQIIVRGNAVEEFAFGVVGMLVAAISDRPGFLDVVGDGGRGRPNVAITGDVTAVVEIVEDAKLPGEFVLVRGDVFAIQGERRIAS